MKPASKDTLAGRRYLDLQREAKRSGRPTDELIQLYALECLLDRLVHSEFADTFILKGGVLLAALDARRPTRDIDFAVRVIENSAEKVLSAVRTSLSPCRLLESINWEIYRVSTPTGILRTVYTVRHLVRVGLCLGKANKVELSDSPRQRI